MNYVTGIVRILETPSYSLLIIILVEQNFMFNYPKFEINNQQQLLN